MRGKNVGKGDSRPDGIHDAGRTCNDKWHYIGSILV